MSAELLRRADVLALLDDGDRHPRKRLGQNFVVDPGTIRRIVDLAGVEAGDRVLEIGPGLGSLTLGLLAAGADVTCVEKDAELAGLLARVVEVHGGGREPHVVVADALDVDLAALTPPPAGWRLVANLPYNVAAQVVLRTLELAPTVTSMLAMAQREVAERLAAGPGDDAYGIPSVLLSLRATARVVGAVAPEVFYPRPRVASALVAVTRRDRPLVDGPAAARVAALVRQGFGQRRKTLRRSLGLEPEVFERAGIDAGDRPEVVAPAAWVRLEEAAR